MKWYAVGCLGLYCVVVLVLIGCTQQATPIAAQQQRPAPPDYKTRVLSPEKHLPAAAKNIQLFNNYWTYFELEVGGKTRKFLMHHSLPKDDWQGRESLVELRD